MYRPPPQARPGLQGALQILCPHSKSAHQRLVSDALDLRLYSLRNHVGVLHTFSILAAY